MNLKAYLLIGVPAAGKSTWIKNNGYDINDDYVIVSSDKYIDMKAVEEGTTYSEAFKKHVKKAMDFTEIELKRAVEEGKNIVWDQTNLNIASRVIRLAKIPNNYQKYGVLFPVPEDLEIRLKSRPGKTIPKHIMKAMMDSYVEPNINEGFDLLYDPRGNVIGKRI